MLASNIQKIFSTWSKANPNPTTELQYRTPFELLIAVILSAQATDISVNKATSKLYPVAHTPEAILALGEEGLIPYIKSIGLYKTKAKNILKTCALLLELHQGKVPESREALEALPGVGRKTANVVLNTAFGEPTIAVDTHIFRVAKRIGLSQGNTPLAVEKDLLEAVPNAYLKNAHHWLILHGRYTCVARKPHCLECIIRDWCEYTLKSTAQSISG